MWKSSVLCLTLVFTFLYAYADDLTEKSNKVNKEEDLTKNTGDVRATSGPANDRPQDLGDQGWPTGFNPLLGYRLPLNGDLKRGRNFGFVGSRGRRGETLGDALFDEEFPVRKPMEGNTRLQMILGNRHQGVIGKEKRKPHFGFHGARG